MTRLRLNESDPVAVSSARNGHAANGQFTKGNAAAKGRRTRREYQTAFDSGCSPQDMEEIVRVAVQQAKQGDHIARAWLGTYALQRPARILDVTTHDDNGGPPDMTLEENAWLREYA